MSVRRASVVWVSPVIEIDDTVESVVVGPLSTVVLKKPTVAGRVRVRDGTAYSNALEDE